MNNLLTSCCLCMIHILKTLDYVKKCEEDLVQMAVLSRPSFTYEPTAEKIYDQPLLGFIQTRSESALQQQQGATKTETSLKSLEDLQTKCSSEDKTTEIDTDDDSSVTSSDKDGSEPEIKMGPAEKRAARKEHKKKVKEDKREARKTKIPKAEKKRRKKLAKAKCSR